MTNPNLTEIICVVDRSGSMSDLKKDAIGGFNTFLEQQKAVDLPCLFTYTQFDTVYEVIHNGVDIKDVPPLDESTYVPRGMTALYDAVGRTIDEVTARLSKAPESEWPGKVIFVILTDGHENSSREYSRDRIFTMIEHQRKEHDWEFVFLAANQDAMGVAQGMGIQRAANFSPVGSTVDSLHKHVSKGVAEYRTACTVAGQSAALDCNIVDVLEDDQKVKVEGVVTETVTGGSVSAADLNSLVDGSGVPPDWRPHDH